VSALREEGRKGGREGGRATYLLEVGLGLLALLAALVQFSTL
jgi:hypothetical protein